MTRRSSRFPALAAILMLAGIAHADSPSLDGKSFVGSMNLQSKKDVPPIPDTFIFADGKFRSSSCDQYGFRPGPYTLKADGTFEAQTISEAAGTMKWVGHVRGDRLEGTVVWIHSKGEGTANYSIQGALQH